GTIATRLSAVRYGPAVEGPDVSEAERADLLRALEDARMLEGRLISRDRTLTAVALFLDRRVEDHDVMRDTVRDIDRSIEAHAPPDGVHVWAAGLPHIFNSIVVKMEQDNLQIIPLTLLVCLLLLYVSFRWVPGTVLPVVAVGISVLITLG